MKLNNFIVALNNAARCRSQYSTDFDLKKKIYRNLWWSGTWSTKIRAQVEEDAEGCLHGVRFDFGVHKNTCVVARKCGRIGKKWICDTHVLLAHTLRFKTHLQIKRRFDIDVPVFSTPDREWMRMWHRTVCKTSNHCIAFRLSRLLFRPAFSV